MDEISVAVEIVYLKVWQVLLFLLTVQPALSNYRKSPGKQTKKNFIPGFCVFKTKEV